MSMLKWYAIILGIILILAGIDNWVHIFPLVQLDSPVAAVLAIIVGVVCVGLGFSQKRATSSGPATG